MKYLIWGLMLISLQSAAQKNEMSKPKLVVGIVIDQMRPDYLALYAHRFGPGGFNRILKKGHECKNVYINYLPSYTGPGHAGIYTGSVPALHGIASNDWIERINGKPMYCTKDTSVQAIGGGDKAGKMSPKNVWSTTITDELKLANHFKSKTIAISLKDRASIIPGGHTANAAYWMDDSLGNFMTSSYYMNQLPNWVNQFNDLKMADRYLNAEWNTLEPLETYIQWGPDNNSFEGKFTGENTTSFPHKISTLKRSDIKKTCYGNNIITDFAKVAIENEQLGQGNFTDFFCISYSSTDYVGHMFGPNSIEMEDTYIRLDKNIEELLNYLDDKIGDQHYTLFLTADHGVAHNPGFLNEHRIPGGNSFGRKLKDSLNALLKPIFNHERIVTQVAENFVWLSDSLLQLNAINRHDVVKKLMATLETFPEVQYAVDMQQIQSAPIPSSIKEMIVNGYVKQRSGDILLLLKPGWLDAYATTGTTHGTWNPYDTHIPLLWYGWGIQRGTTYTKYHMADIAPTLADLLQIQVPNASIGQCIQEVIKR